MRYCILKILSILFTLEAYLCSEAMYEKANLIANDNEGESIGLQKEDSYRYNFPVIAESNMVSDDEEDFDLLDIITLSEAELEDDPLRTTDEDREAIIRIHNAYRSNLTGPLPPGSDVHYMEYNKKLEVSAKMYITLCRWAHGFHPNDTYRTSSSGQCLFKGNSRSFPFALYLWYNEWPDYNMTIHECVPGRKCAHYTQVVWGRTYEIGCARHMCPARMVFINCHYYPIGNSFNNQDDYVYQVGLPCTRNPLKDGSLCHKNLCVDKRICREHNLDCTCEAKCKNCGVFNAEKCKCECKVGWDWEDCGEPCKNIYVPNPKKKYHYSTCAKTFGGMACKDFDYLRMCRLHCKKCQPLDPKKPPPDNATCCGGKMCERYYILNNKCECKLACPSRACMFNITDINEYDSNSSPTLIYYKSFGRCRNYMIAVFFIVHYVFKLVAAL